MRSVPRLALSLRNPSAGLFPLLSSAAPGSPGGMRLLPMLPQARAALRKAPPALPAQGLPAAPHRSQRPRMAPARLHFPGGMRFARLRRAAPLSRRAAGTDDESFRRLFASIAQDKQSAEPESG